MTRTLLLAAMFLSAVLLFLVQPLYAKYLLPEFGGSSSVWTISLFFYSGVLLCGYLYASVLIRWPMKFARLIHGALLVLVGALFLSRGLAGDHWLFIESLQVGGLGLSVLLTLFQAVGLPVLLLASTSVLVQHLYAQHTDEEPYRLFGLSNAGSLLGLAVFPFLLEPFFTLSFLAGVWVFLFIAYMLVLLAAWRQVERSLEKEPVVEPDAYIQPITRWAIIGLALIPTFLMASMTELFSRGIASFPLMWVIPLMLYLVSFIIAFSDRKPIFPQISTGFLCFLALIPFIVTLPVMNTNSILYWFAFLYGSLSLFLISIFFHKQIYALRPHHSGLGTYYVYLTLGGALGSGAVGFLMPLILNRTIEAYMAVAMLMIYFSLFHSKVLDEKLPSFYAGIVQGGSIILALALVLAETISANMIYSDRNFYGSLKILERDVRVNDEMIPARVIIHGSTNHGLQALDDRYSEEAASYYGNNSGIDLAIRSFTERGESPRVNVVGLGAGMMSAYCDELAQLDYIEINEAVEPIAREYFTYLDMCTDKTTITTADGRIALEEFARKDEKQYDVIMMDAFSDDAIPAHLLTTEAFEDAYLPLLSEDGIIAFHISNRYLNLRGPIIGSARAANLQVIEVENTPDKSNGFHFPTVWVLVSQGQSSEELLAFENAKLLTDEGFVWTDEKKSVLSILSLNGSLSD